MRVYIGAVVLFAVLCLVVTLVAADPPDSETDVLILVALGLILVVLGDSDVEGHTTVSLLSVIMLAAYPITGVMGAAALSLYNLVLLGRAVPWRARIFNAAQSLTYACLGGTAFTLTGGVVGLRDVGDARSLVLGLGLPLLVAALVILLTNALLMAGIVHLSDGAPVRLVLVSLLRGTGFQYLANGFIAFVLAVLWRPAHLGPVAILLVLAPLVVAQWIYRQHAEDLRGQDQVLEVLVAAVEAKAPHLAGHSGRVAALSQRVAEQLGLGPQAVSDIRLAGMLHDIGQTTLPTPVVRAFGTPDPSFSHYPDRGADLLVPLGFLRGALSPIAGHHLALEGAGDEVDLPSRIVGLADEYDLLTEVGTVTHGRLTHEEAVAALEERPGTDSRLMDVLRSTSRSAEVRSAE